ncbi:MAG: UBA/THIF-type NAD/FAD binding protein [Candidatus Magnetoglobus multicellularis str. Araruama]|uniref:UBA/THIF-type NAD/FAD binding protein n=1 Tax=Candidatus Magnetoglobus multicellularis str. Araruama TaxID=890399 RepID=A0A1V1P6P0_9BACT|nr:MAG: UBA/THIF-type NAD/FAD binding protein [Candidatus Magnetoglobus multicellularis str. Araruama]
MNNKNQNISDRYDRQQRIKGWNQNTLLNSRILVAGAGALANEYIKNIALTGIGHIFVIDFDHIEASNLNRTVLFHDSDILKQKAETIAGAVKRINSDIDIRYMNADLLYDIGMGFYRHVDLVVGCLDNLYTRAHVGICCSLTGTPYLDGGMWAMGGEVRWFLPGQDICFDCTLNSEDRKRAYERRSCSGFKIHEVSDIEASNVSTTSVIGGIMSHETVKYLSGWDVAGSEAIVYNGLNMTMHKSILSGNPDCSYHSPYPDIIELDYCASELKVKDLFELNKKFSKDSNEEPVLELNRDFYIILNADHAVQNKKLIKFLQK